MKAAMLRGIRDIEIVETPRPGVAPGEVLIQVRACAICGTDVKMFNHGYAPSAFPFILGHELSGIVDEVGEGVPEVTPGERVVIAPNIPCGACSYCRRGMQTACDRLRTIGVHLNGGFADYVLVPAEAVRAGCVIPLPDRVGFDEATLVDPASSVINAFELLDVGCDDTLVVIGAGPTGCLGVEIGRSLGVRKTILIQRSPERLALAEFTAADVFIDSSAEDADKRVKEETSSRGADAILVACGSAEAQRQSVHMVAKRGRISFFGGLPKGASQITLDSNEIHYKEAAVVGAHGGSTRHCEIALHLIANHRIHGEEYVRERLGIDSFLSAISLAEARKTLKVVVDPRQKAGAAP